MNIKNIQLILKVIAVVMPEVVIWALTWIGIWFDMNGWYCLFGFIGASMIYCIILYVIRAKWISWISKSC